MSDFAGQEWVLLSYRLPREPSTPRLALWRKLRKLGVAQLGDGLVALPLDARNTEALEWSAEGVVEAGGEATVWLARPGSRRDSEAIAASLRAARNDEYQALLDEASAAKPQGVDGRTLGRLRRTHREVSQRDYFGAPLAQSARDAIEALAADRGVNP